MDKIKLKPGQTYHVYNHANGPENLFVEEKNYPFFLEKYQKHISPVANTHSFCLMPNHFHLLLTFKNQEELSFLFSDLPGFGNLEGLDTENKNDLTEKIISKQFSNLFNSYTKAFNKTYDRRGSLFLKSFKRKPVESVTQFINTLLYIHLNPVKHGFTNHFADWKWTSYHDFLIPKENPLIDSKYVLSHFESLKAFKQLHETKRLEILKLNELE